MDALSKHEFQALDAMMAEDVVWSLGPTTLNGKADVLAALRFDAGLGTEFRSSDVAVQESTVTFELRTSSEVTKALGIQDVRYYPRMTFEDGLVTRVEDAKPPAGAGEVLRKMEPFLAWAAEHRPEALDSLQDPRGRMIFSREAGEIQRRLVREWMQAGAPGRGGSPQPARGL
jgi:hypothetical protein